jgi:hypothetical protein
MVYLLAPLAPSMKVADLTGTKGCYGLNLELLVFQAGQSIGFGIGSNAQSLLDGTNNINTLGLYNGFFLPDSDFQFHRLFQRFADQLWARNFNTTLVQSFDVQPYRCR